MWLVLVLVRCVAGCRLILGRQIDWRLRFRCRQRGRWHFRQLLCSVIAIILDCGCRALDDMQMLSCVGNVAANGSLLEGSPCRGDFLVCGGPRTKVLTIMVRKDEEASLVCTSASLFVTCFRVNQGSSAAS